MENIGLLIYGGAFVVVCYVGWKVYMKLKAKK